MSEQRADPWESEVLTPSYRDVDQHYLTARQTRFIGSYVYEQAAGRLYISDPVWGQEVLGDEAGDEIFLELYQHPVFQRLAAIEQLTLPKEYATMPGSFDFTRWEHVWGSVVFVRKMLRQAEAQGRAFDPNEKLHMQLRTLLSDAGHTAFSHLGDWIKQSFGGTEDSHDIGLPELLEGTGITGILLRHGIDPAAVTMPDDANDFVECPSPDLCTDRVDYGCREIARWVEPGSERDWLPYFSIDEQNRLVMSDKRAAKRFACAFGLLATEHWGQPVHRLQLQLFAELVKGAVLDEPLLFRHSPMHVTDMLYTIDDDLMTKTRMIGELNNDLHAVLLDIARAQRRIFSWGKEKDIQQFIFSVTNESYARDKDADFLNPLHSGSWAMEYTGTKPQNVELIPVEAPDEVSDFDACPHTLDVYLPPLKPRGVDPLYYDEDEAVRRLSEEDAQYKKLSQQQRQIQSQAYVARIYMAPDAASRLKHKICSVREQWEGAVSQKRTPESAKHLYETFEFMGLLALSSASRSIRLRYG